MIKKLTFAAALAAATVLGGVANAKTLVYCSEASPAGFDPSPWSGGNDFDASSRTIYSRLVEFEHGKTSIMPGLAESWTVSDDGLEYTFKLRPGVKFQTTDYFTPTRDLNADDVIFSFERQWKKDSPWFDIPAGHRLGVLHRHGLPGAAQGNRQGRRPDRQVRAQQAGSRLPARPWHGLRLDRLEGICRPA